MTSDIATEVVESIADARGVEPVDMDLVVGDYVDLDALSQLANRDDTAWTVTFELPAHEVTVTDDGTVLVDDRPGQESMRA